MAVFREAIDIYAIDLAIIDQTESMGNKDCSLTDSAARFQFTDFAAGLGSNTHLLAIEEAKDQDIIRVHGNCARLFAVIPFWISH